MSVEQSVPRQGFADDDFPADPLFGVSGVEEQLRMEMQEREELDRLETELEKERQQWGKIEKELDRATMQRNMAILVEKDVQTQILELKAELEAAKLEIQPEKELKSHYMNELHQNLAFEKEWRLNERYLLEELEKRSHLEEMLVAAKQAALDARNEPFFMVPAVDPSSPLSPQQRPQSARNRREGFPMSRYGGPSTRQNTIKIRPPRMGRHRSTPVMLRETKYRGTPSDDDEEPVFVHRLGSQIAFSADATVSIERSENGLGAGAGVTAVRTTSENSDIGVSVVNSR
jgi:hypothetical protein